MEEDSSIVLVRLTEGVITTYDNQSFHQSLTLLNDSDWVEVRGISTINVEDLLRVFDDSLETDWKGSFGIAIGENVCSELIPVFF